MPIWEDWETLPCPNKPGLGSMWALRLLGMYTEKKKTEGLQPSHGAVGEDPVSLDNVG